MSIKVAQNDFTKKLKILTPLQKLPKNVVDLGKLFVFSNCCHRLCKVAQSGHAGLTNVWSFSKTTFSKAENILATF